MGYIGQAPANKVITSADIEDGIVVASDIADDSITLAKMASGTDGNVISYDASGNPVAIATGSDGEVLTSAGAGQPPAFESVSAGTALTGSTNNQVVTVTGANAITGESGLIFDGSNLGVGCTPSAKFEVEDGGTGTGNVLVKITLDDQSSHYGLSVGNDSHSTTDNLGLMLMQDNSGNGSIYNNGHNPLYFHSGGEVTKPTQPAFSAKASAGQDNLSATTWYTGAFDTEVFDVNADYNNSTYTFTAPVTGKYLFTVVATVNAFSGRPYSYFNTSNRNYTQSYYAGALSGNGETINGSTIADMDANDTCKWQIYAYDDSAWDLQGYYFTGTLLC